MERLLQGVMIVGALLAMTAVGLFYNKGQKTFPLIAQSVNEYVGPTRKMAGPEKVRVQILVHDDPHVSGEQIVQAEFNHQTISLKPRDIYGFRGQTSMQMPPGKYLLRWRVKRDAYVWPRTVYHTQEITLDPTDMWIQITITGNRATVS
jgi:hypothetical protein